MNVQSLGNKLHCVIDHITDNRIDIVGIIETWLSNDDKNNMSVVNTCLNNGYTLLHRPRNTGRRGGGVGVLINNQINVKSRMIGVNPEITSFESMEVVITAGSITIRLSVIYRMPPVKSKNGLKQGTFCNEFNDYLEKLSCMNGNIVIVGDLSRNSSLGETLSIFSTQYPQESEVKQFNCYHLIKEEKGQKKFMRTAVTATRTGYEFHVGNNGKANQSKYPMELRARLTRQNLQ